MPGINPDTIAHKLNMNHKKKLVQQRKKRFAKEKSDNKKQG